MSAPGQTLIRLRQLGWLLAGAAAITGLDASGAPTSGTGTIGASACTKSFTAPRQPMTLTRTLRRDLGPGAELVTRRSYRITITPEGSGFRIDGELTGVEVTVPPQLEAIAQLERNRPEHGLFPIMLDAQGVIIALPDPGPASSPTAAVDIAKAMVTGSPLAAGDRAEMLQFFDRMLGARGGVLTKWPQDLFRPAATQRSATSNIPMSDGQTGHVTMTLEATADGACGLLRSFERTVITDLGGLQRVSRERWTLVPLTQ